MVLWCVKIVKFHVEIENDLLQWAYENVYKYVCECASVHFEHRTGILSKKEQKWGINDNNKLRVMKTYGIGNSIGVVLYHCVRL